MPLMGYWSQMLKGKANILNNLYGSAFTHENKTNIPDLGPTPYPVMRTPVVAKILLTNLDPNVNKAVGSDMLSPRF